MESSGALRGVLSDGTIRARLTELIVDGDPSRAEKCAYKFTPGKLYPTGTDGHGGKPVLDWTNRADLPPETAYRIRPGELVLLRTYEQVQMPKDVCGLWFQTDHLSRDGLLLVNTSVIPPGYQGFLTCTFVNFGQTDVELKPTQAVAKIVFLGLDLAAENPSGAFPARAYDQSMAESARKAPTTFLGIAETTNKLERLLRDATADISRLVDGAKKDLTAQTEKLAAEAAMVATNAGKEEGAILRNQLREDAKGAVIRALPWAGVAILLLAAATWFSGRIAPSDLDKLAKERADQIEANISRQLESVGGKPVFVYSGTAEAKALNDRIVALEEQLRVLSAKATPAPLRVPTPAGKAQ